MDAFVKEDFCRQKLDPLLNVPQPFYQFFVPQFMGIYQDEVPEGYFLPFSGNDPFRFESQTLKLSEKLYSDCQFPAVFPSP
ncbi:hypothetical protein DSECCO2_632340 [anaerobic digester metagenome]